jgi:hypothetical protein
MDVPARIRRQDLEEIEDNANASKFRTPLRSTTCVSTHAFVPPYFPTAPYISTVAGPITVNQGADRPNNATFALCHSHI